MTKQTHLRCDRCGDPADGGISLLRAEGSGRSRQTIELCVGCASHLAGGSEWFGPEHRRKLDEWVDRFLGRKGDAA